MSNPPSAAAVEALAARIRACRICRDQPRYGAPLPQEPRPLLQVSATARICIASQAPGIRAHTSGIPFDDASGRRLREWLGMSDSEFYDSGKVAIIPMGFCFPGTNASGGDKPPRRECAETWHDGLFRLLTNLELFVLIGRYAIDYHLPAARALSVNDAVAGWRAFYGDGGGTGVRKMPLPHSSWRNNGWIRRNPWFEEELLPVLRADVRRLLS